MGRKRYPSKKNNEQDGHLVATTIFVAHNILVVGLREREREREGCAFLTKDIIYRCIMNANVLKNVNSNLILILRVRREI